MSCNCGKDCFDGLSAADANVLKVLREGGLASLSTVEFELLVRDVVKAGGVRAVGGTSRRVIEDAVGKAAFSSRSEAGRYAAEQRWKGNTQGAVDFPAGSARRQSGLTTAVVDGRSRTYRGRTVKAREVKVGDLVGGEAESTPNRVLGVVVPAEAAEKAGRQMRLVVAPVNQVSARSTMSMSPNRSLVLWEELAEKAFGGAAPYMDRSAAGRYAAEQRWKGHVSAAEVRQQQRGKNGTPVGSAREAIDAVARGEQVVVEPSQVYTILAELAKFAQEAKAKGKDAPDLDLCKISVPNTNLFCGDNVGLTRDQMPQLSGKPKAGSKADKMPKDAKGRVDLAQAFMDDLAKRGVKTVEGEVKASSLRASQNQLIGADVAGIMGAIESGKMGESVLFVSKDGYVIDGHHRWAATVGLDYKDGDGEDFKMKVRVIDMPIMEVLAAAVKFSDDMGIPRRSGDVKEDARTKLEE